MKKMRFALQTAFVKADKPCKSHSQKGDKTLQNAVLQKKLHIK